MVSVTVLGRSTSLLMAFMLVGCSFGASLLIDEFDLSGDIDVKYVALGDSITYGYGDGPNGRMPMPYPCQVADRMDFRQHINLGVNGATVSDLWDNNTMAQLSKVPKDADIVSVMIGVNDFGNNVPLGNIGDDTISTIYGGLEHLVSGLMERCPDAFVFFMTPFQFLSYPGTNQQGYTLKDVADAVSEVCSLHCVPVLDMYHDGNFSYDTDPHCDGLHPTERFFKRYMVPMVVEFIERECPSTILERH